MKHVLGSRKGDKVKELDQIRNYLSVYGFYRLSKAGRYQMSRLTGHDFNVFDRDMEKTIKRDISGILNEKTLSLSLTANPRYDSTSIKHKVKLVRNPFKGGSFYVLGATRFSKLNLTWAVPPTTLPHVLNATESAFRSWKAAVPTFNFDRSNDFHGADIQINFVRGDHGDGFPFEGRQGTFAHAFPPPVGVLHLNTDIAWVVGAVPGKVDIETVVLHELGHVFGLQHSNVSSAVMWATGQRGMTKGLFDLWLLGFFWVLS
ncbi:metalloendoproteinase 1-MMP-like [Impatiens glandulifera]|uniref:metalloendoproteinase 1-MMP-like n=1 Tax=Impatiens glandulifera TaxID=253017 RepID=UPI001FB06BA3|nr:metalloendoproteinase 1-MMP-like [Impatiens glandulifera]